MTPRTKGQWRDHVSGLPPQDDVAGAVVDALLAFLADIETPVATYMALRDEVDLQALLPHLTRPVLPRLEGDRITWRAASGPLDTHPLGFRQPTAEADDVASDTLGAVLVPGRAFDRAGVRLGRGGGHYDRLLARLSPAVPAIGVCAHRRIVDVLPREPHDRPMTHLATEHGVQRVG